MAEPVVPLPARRPAKAATAFRTISEVAEELVVPQHVLRFWESKFPQVKPLKRGGGRRYYRPEDVVLLRRIRQCLYDQGYTIRGVQRLLREGSLKLVQSEPPTASASPAPVSASSSVPSSVGASTPSSAPAALPLSGEARATLEELRRELVALRALLPRGFR